jgi:hypothetical protein
METQIFEKYQRLFLAEDCRPPQLNECLLWRKQTLRTIISASANDPSRTLSQISDSQKILIHQDVFLKNQGIN